MLPLHKLPGLIQLRLIMEAVINAHNQCLKIGDHTGATSMETLFQKVGLELYARKMMRVAALAPKRLGREEETRFACAAADNYHGLKRGPGQKDGDQPGSN